MKNSRSIIILEALAALIYIFLLYGCYQHENATEAVDNGVTVEEDSTYSEPTDTMAVPTNGGDEEPSTPPLIKKQEAVEGYLKRGNMGYYVPDSMEVNVPSRVSLVISKNKTESQLSESIQESIEHEARADTSRIVLESIEVSKQMTAKVYAMDNTTFRITPLSRVQQYVDLEDTSETKWEWSVIPLREGRHNLIIKASAKVYDGEIEEWIDIEVYNGVVPVRAIPEPDPMLGEKLINAWKANWQWLLPTLGAVGGLITWLLSTFGKKRGN